MTDHYTPVHELRCRTCSGRSTVIRADDPRGMTWACPHHGEGDEDRGTFAECGVGEVGTEFEVGEFHVLDLPPTEVSASVPYPASRCVDEVRFDDYEAVVIEGLSPPEQARRRGVTGGTVRSNVADAREALEVDV